MSISNFKNTPNRVEIIRKAVESLNVEKQLEYCFTPEWDGYLDIDRIQVNEVMEIMLEVAS